MNEIEILQKIKHQYDLAILDADCGDIDALNAIKDNKAAVTALNSAVEALEKQIPKRVVPFSERNLDTKVCPCCKNICAYWKQKCCDKCGQRLEW